MDSIACYIIDDNIGRAYDNMFKLFVLQMCTHTDTDVYTVKVFACMCVCV